VPKSARSPQPATTGAHATRTRRKRPISLRASPRRAPTRRDGHLGSVPEPATSGNGGPGSGPPSALQ
jgi:hypothetical protein